VEAGSLIIILLSKNLVLKAMPGIVWAKSESLKFVCSIYKTLIKQGELMLSMWNDRQRLGLFMMIGEITNNN
jgi:hypothetical protein